MNNGELGFVSHGFGYDGLLDCRVECEEGLR